MANYFVDGTAGSDSTGTGASWTSPYQTVTKALAAAVTASDSNPVIACGSTGAYSAGAAITWTGPTNGTVAIISATNLGSGTTITPAAGASESVGAFNGSFTISQGATATFTGFFISGMTMTAGNGNAGNIVIGSNNKPGYLEFDTCTFDLPSTSTVLFELGSSGNSTSGVNIKFVNPSLIVGSRAGQLISLAGGQIEFIGPFSLTFGATKPAELITQASAARGTLIIRDGDISAFTGTAFVLQPITTATIIFENLLLSGTPTITSGSWSGGDASIELRNCSTATSSPPLYDFAYYNSYGTLTATEGVYAAGGAEFNGANISWEIVTTSLCSEYSPFVTPLIEIWTTQTSAQSGTIQITCGTTLTDQDIAWAIDFAASASNERYTYQTSRNAAPITGSPNNVPSSSVSWTGGLTETQQIENNFTAAAVGLLLSNVSVYRASTTLYLDPYIGGVT